MCCVAYTSFQLGSAPSLRIPAANHAYEPAGHHRRFDFGLIFTVEMSVLDALPLLVLGVIWPPELLGQLWRPPHAKDMCAADLIMPLFQPRLGGRMSGGAETTRVADFLHAVPGVEKVKKAIIEGRQILPPEADESKKSEVTMRYMPDCSLVIHFSRRQILFDAGKQLRLDMEAEKVPKGSEAVAFLRLVLPDPIFCAVVEDQLESVGKRLLAKERSARTFRHKWMTARQHSRISAYNNGEVALEVWPGEMCADSARIMALHQQKEEVKAEKARLERLHTNYVASVMSLNSLFQLLADKAFPSTYFNSMVCDVPEKGTTRKRMLEELQHSTDVALGWARDIGLVPRMLLADELTSDGTWRKTSSFEYFYFKKMGAHSSLGACVLELNKDLEKRELTAEEKAMGIPKPRPLEAVQQDIINIFHKKGITELAAERGCFEAMTPEGQMELLSLLQALDEVSERHHVHSRQAADMHTAQCQHLLLPHDRARAWLSRRWSPAVRDL